jgi:hypothetical protein
MHPDLATEIATLPRLRVSALRARFAAAFGEPTHSHNKVWLVKRIAWRLQALAEGGLPERAHRRAAELVQEADLRLSAPPAAAAPSEPAGPLRWPSDERLPRSGTILARRYKGRTLQVHVLDHGFRFEDQVYRSLSAVAKAVTGSHCSGHFFFRLTEKGTDQ